MSDAALQALLDPDASGHGIQLLKRVDEIGGVTCSYYVRSGAPRANNISGAAKWVDCLIADNDATKNTAIRAALGVP